MSDPVLGIGITALNKSRQNLCPHGAYILVYLPMKIKCSDICEIHVRCKTIYTRKIGTVEVQTNCQGWSGLHSISFRQQKSTDNRFYYPRIDKETEGHAVGDFMSFLSSPGYWSSNLQVIKRCCKAFIREKLWWINSPKIEQEVRKGTFHLILNHLWVWPNAAKTLESIFSLYSLFLLLSPWGFCEHLYLHNCQQEGST